MIRVTNWMDNDVIKRDVKSCDNHEIGEVQEVDQSYLTVKKGGRVIRVPRGTVATFDGDKLWLRATEAEVLAGIYPFKETIPSESQSQNTTSERNTAESSAVQPPPSSTS